MNCNPTSGAIFAADHAHVPSTMTAIDRVMAELPDARKVGQQWLARCTAQEDGHPSLSVTTGSKGKVVVIYRAGCRTEDVVAALGLTMMDLFEPRKPRRQRSLVTYPAGLRVRADVPPRQYVGVR